MPRSNRLHRFLPPLACTPHPPLPAWRTAVFVIVGVLVLIFVRAGHSPLAALGLAVLTGFGAVEVAHRLFTTRLASTD